MSWSILQDVPNPHIDLNGDPYAGAVLKAYLPGTTTSASIAIDSSGSSPQASITYNAEGKLEVSGNEILPFINKAVKWGIFANATDAAANTPFSMGPFDNIKPLNAGDSIEHSTLAEAVANLGAVDGQISQITDRADGQFEYKTGQTSNARNIVAADATGLDLVLRIVNNNHITAQYGVNSTSGINTMISEIAAGETLTISNGTSYDREGLSEGLAITIIHQEDTNYEQANIQVGDFESGHISFYGRAGSGVWSIPRLGSGGIAPQTASFKAFHDDYIYEREVHPTNSSYRVGIFTSDLDNSAMGVGSTRIDGKGGGEYTGTNPDVLITQRDGDFIHARAVTIPSQPANTTINGYDLYQFDDENAAWSAGIAVVSGQLIMTYGRVLEAQNTGTTGASRPRHGTYAQQVLTIVDGSQYAIGEFVIDTTNPTPLRQAKIDDIIGNDLYLQSGTPETWDNLWLVGATLKGLTGLSSQTIAVSALVNKSFTGTGVRDYPLENEFSFTGRPVAGLVQSDGAINWKFIDDIKEFVPTNVALKQILMLGDVKDKQPVQGMGNTVEMVNGGVLVGDDGLLMYCPINNNTFKVARNSSCEFEIMNPTGTNSVAMSETGEFLAFRSTAIQLAGATINDSATPSVKGLNVLNMGSAAPINVTAFSNGIPFQEVIFRATTGGITLVEGAGFSLIGGGNILLSVDDVVKFVTFDGTQFVHIGGNI